MQILKYWIYKVIIYSIKAFYIKAYKMYDIFQNNILLSFTISKGNYFLSTGHWKNEYKD